MKHLKNFYDGIMAYMIILMCVSFLLIGICAVVLFLGIQEPNAPMQTIGDAFDIFVVGFLFDGNCIGAVAWKWHVVIALFFAIANSIIEAK